MECFAHAGLGSIQAFGQGHLPGEEFRQRVIAFFQHVGDQLLHGPRFHPRQHGAFRVGVFVANRDGTGGVPCRLQSINKSVGSPGNGVVAPRAHRRCGVRAIAIDLESGDAG